MESLQAISPVDGRYRSKTEALAPYFSEEALIHYRLRVEVDYLVALIEYDLPGLPGASAEEIIQIKNLGHEAHPEAAKAVKKHERITNHDVKAVEYYLKDRLQELGLGKYSEFVHFALTSQDINNTAVPLSIKEALHDVLLPAYDRLIGEVRDRSKQWKEVPMLARTHGQAASPTTVGKEWAVFAERLRIQREMIDTIPIEAKFGGATGNFNAHLAAFPDRDWESFANDFVNDTLGLQRLRHTTQISHYDLLAALFQAFMRINTVLIDLCRDIWHYISIHYFHQKVKAGEVGSSTMPHKVNPIDFENAEGNLGMANAVFQFLANKLPVSRLQRDLTDSTVLRNVGLPFAHSLIALKSIQKGLSRLELNREQVRHDLDQNWAVVAEAIQTVLRREGYPKPYEALKDLTRGNQQLGESEIRDFISGLKLPDRVKDELRSFTPHNYIGNAAG